jgi:transcriptional regulator of acetoin/glycerol metabolism
MTDGNVSAAARLVGIERKAMERKVRRHKVSK